MEQRYFYCTLDQLREVRSWAATCCHRFDCPQVCETVVLVVNELVANAFVHAHTDCRVFLQISAGVLLGSVRDFGGGEIRPVDTIGQGSAARGLRVVDGLTDGWTVNYHHRGKTVSFRIPCTVVA